MVGGAFADLRDHPSPYLAMHAADPVAWTEWNSATLARAKGENRLILVSVGYFACHWCHVMQRESWQDPEVARLLNASFIPVKVDREINTALDSRLQAFTERTRGMAGWPLNVFITPEGYPLFAMTYAPRDEFLRIARALEERWRADPERLATLARDAASQAAQIKSARGQPPNWPGNYLDAVRQRLDSLRGGFEGSSKFPMTPQLMAVLEHLTVNPTAKPGADLRAWLLSSLEQMRDGGLRDQVAGGFFRYTVDPDWQEPHFEKMLYDNAQLARLYLRAGRLLGRPDFTRAGLETLDFMLREMRVGKAFLASLSAVDIQGEEGGAYLWSKEALRRALDGRQWRAAERIWGLDMAPVFPAGYLPVPRRAPLEAERKDLSEALAKLRAAREALRRVHAIPRDQKVLAGWNGLVLSALAEASPHGAHYRQAGVDLLRVLRQRLWNGARLSKGFAGDAAGNKGLLGEAELEDYAYLAQGAWEFGQRNRNPAAKSFALQLLRAAWRDFRTSGGLSADRANLLAGTSTDAWEDDFGPAPAAVLVAASLASGVADLRGQARRALARVRIQPVDYVLGKASLSVLATAP